MALQTVGETTHFLIQYDDTTGLAGLAVASAVLAICEVDLFKLSAHMPFQRGVAGDFFVDPKIAVRVLNDPINGPGFNSAKQFGMAFPRQSVIMINPFSALNVAITPDYAGFLFVAEMSELLMGFYGWDAASSQGEALSRVMAEELHPASTSNFINLWLGSGRPRPDFISRNQLSIGGIVRGDLEVIAFGCGIVFIYFLRYQLGFGYAAICGAGGSLLSDRYRNLTKATDDPAARVEALLDRHFGVGEINLVTNNPFPLYDRSERKVLLGFGPRASLDHRLPDSSGEVKIRPFFSCPASVYPYDQYGSSVVQTITATTVGIGFPSFRWRINGQLLFLGNRNGTVSCSVDVPVPQSPSQPARQTGVLAFDYHLENQFAATSSTSSLTITSRSFEGDYLLDMRVEAEEQFVPGDPVAVDQGITIRMRSVVYGGTYAVDRARCEKSFEDAMSSRLHEVLDPLSVIHNLPDPQPGYLQALLEAGAKIHGVLARLAETDHARATEVAHYVSEKLNVPAHVFLKGARGGHTGA
jgi:hypothetical protein